MPPFETMDRRQDAVLWKFSGYDQHGQPTINAVPIDLKVRWNDVIEEAQDAQGNTIQIHGEVVVGVIDIPNGSVMWKGTVAGLPASYPTPLTDLMEVQSFSITKDIKGRNVRRTLKLARFKGVLPTTNG